MESTQPSAPSHKPTACIRDNAPAHRWTCGPGSGVALVPQPVQPDASLVGPWPVPGKQAGICRRGSASSWPALTRRKDEVRRRCTVAIKGRITPERHPAGIPQNAKLSLVLQCQFREGCGVMPAWRRGAWHGSVWPVRYCPAYPPATAATQPTRTVPGAAFPAPPGRPAAS